MGEYVRKHHFSEVERVCNTIDDSPEQAVKEIVNLGHRIANENNVEPAEVADELCAYNIVGADPKMGLAMKKNRQEEMYAYIKTQHPEIFQKAKQMTEDYEKEGEADEVYFIVLEGLVELVERRLAEQSASDPNGT